MVRWLHAMNTIALRRLSMTVTISQLKNALVGSFNFAKLTKLQIMSQFRQRLRQCGGPSTF